MGDGGRREFLVAQPCAEHPTHATVSRLAHEHDLKDYLDHPWALRPLELVREHGQTMLVLEPTTARPLDEMIGPGLPVGTFLRLAIAVTNAVARLHQCGLVHKDIKASNILIDAASGDARLTGFGIASRLPRERQTLDAARAHRGNALPHGAGADREDESFHRFAQRPLLTRDHVLSRADRKAFPSAASEPMEWVHCHIARKPAPPKAVSRGDSAAALGASS